MKSWDDEGPADAALETVVHWFERDGGWWVRAGDTTLHPADRAAAFEAAKDLARRTSPSRLSSEAPPGWQRGPEPPGSPVERAAATQVGAVEWSRLAGPRALGRSLLVSSGDEVPGPWEGCPKMVVTDTHLHDPSFLSAVRATFLSRSPVVYELEDGLRPPPPAVRGSEVFDTAVDHDFVAEAAWALLARNSVDARGGVRVWSSRRTGPSRSARRPGQRTDVVLAERSRRVVRRRRAPPVDVRRTSRTTMPTVVPFEAVDVRRARGDVASSAVDADLASDQLEAVEDPDVRARIIAPAGSGKTRVLTERARHLLAILGARRRAHPRRVQQARPARDGRADPRPPADCRSRPSTRSRSPSSTARGGSRRGGRRVDTVDELVVRELLRLARAGSRGERTRIPPRRGSTRSRGSGSGLRSPRSVEEEFGGDVEGLAEVFPRYRSELARRGRGRLRRADLPAASRCCSPSPRSGARPSAAASSCSSTSSRTSPPRTCCSCASSPDPRSASSASATTTRRSTATRVPRRAGSSTSTRSSRRARHHALTVNYRCPRAGRERRPRTCCRGTGSGSKRRSPRA